jgi:carboxymethylenebutenolidase
MGHMIEISGVTAYRADPEGTPKGGLVLIHEIWGLVAHIKDLADRFAAEGYLVVAPDILSRIGIEPRVGLDLFSRMFSPDEATRLEVQPELREALAPSRSPEYAAGALASLRSVVDYLEAQPGVDGRIAVTGFCFGGTFSFALAAADPRISAALPWYGTAPLPESMASIACPVLALYGGVDEALMTALPDVTRSMAEAGVDFTSHVYDGAKHAFFNDTSINYDAAAAADAWPRALAFLESSLGR